MAGPIVYENLKKYFLENGYSSKIEVSYNDLIKNIKTFNKGSKNFLLVEGELLYLTK